ncbi:MAG: hypothetical protein IT301_06275 [Dehalococcoidia bacterium]|nr:hypothetical protein [Dehalococcoidia bacterium]
MAAADYLKRPRREALIAAGYFDLSEESDQEEPAPAWLKGLKGLIAELREADLTQQEARIVETQVRGLLQLREERERYGEEE